jgi:hypothetical protein
MTKLFFGCLASIALSVAFANAGTRTHIGVGNASCGTWIEARKQPGSPSNLQLRSWLFGFMSGVNDAMQAQGDLLAGQDADALVVWMDKYCSDSPLVKIDEGANSLARELLTRGMVEGRIKLP